MQDPPFSTAPSIADGTVIPASCRKVGAISMARTCSAIVEPSFAFRAAVLTHTAHHTTVVMLATLRTAICHAPAVLVPARRTHSRAGKHSQKERLGWRWHLIYRRRTWGAHEQRQSNIFFVWVALIKHLRELAVMIATTSDGIAPSISTSPSPPPPPPPPPSSAKAVVRTVHTTRSSC